MSFWKQTEITDIFGQLAQLTPDGSLLTVEPYRLAGGLFNNASGVPDANFWTVVNTNGGTTTTANAQATLATNTTANGATQVQSTGVARFIGSCINQYWGSIQLGDTGTANNTRRWGAFNGTDGAYFKLSGTTLSIATMKGGVETAVASASWNQSTTVPTLTNVNNFVIRYNTREVWFIINGTIVHIVSALASTWANTMHFPVWQDNVNSAGSTTNLSLLARNAAIFRLGRWDTEDRYVHGAGAGTTVCKYGPGVLHRIVINTFQSSGSATLTIYDNTAGSGTVIAVISGPAQAQPCTLSYEVDFYTGLTTVAVGTWDFTVIYE